MSALSKVREAILHLEEAEKLLFDARWAFSKDSIEWDKITAQGEVAGDAVYILKNGVLAHIESNIYQAANKACTGLAVRGAPCEVCKGVEFHASDCASLNSPSR